MERNPFDLSNNVIKITTRFNSHYEYDVKVESVVIPTIPGTDGNKSSTQYSLSSGYSVEIFQCLQFILNFKYTINSDVDVYNLVNASANDVDLYLAAYSLYEKRALYADPTFVTGNSRVVAFVNNDFEQLTHDLLSAAFSENMIYLFPFLGFISVTSLVIVANLEGHSSLDSIFHALAVILIQAGHLKLLKTTSRLTLLVISVSTFIIYFSFSASMISLSAVNRHRIDSVDALMHSKYNVLMEVGNSNSTIRLMLERMSKIQQVKMLLSLVKTSHKYYSQETISGYIQAVYRTPTAYIIDEESGLDAVKALIGDLPCEWGRIPIFSLQYPWSMFLKKKSPFKAAINYGILKLQETGILHRIKKTWLPTTSHCTGELNNPFRSIHLSQIQNSFVCLAAGAFCSLLCLTVVCYIDKTKKIHQEGQQLHFQF